MNDLMSAKLVRNIDGEYLVEADKISKSFKQDLSDEGGVDVIRDFSLRVEKNKIITLFGPNGCGKSTILNIFAGIFEPDSGEVIWRSSERTPLSLGYVFQTHLDTLLPWRNVWDNIALPLEVRGISISEQKKRIFTRLEQLHLTEHAQKYVYQLSGGLKQLVAIARATIYNPEFLILDEPFSALDYSLARTLWVRFREFWISQSVTTMFVSHNIDEAIFLGDRVVVLSMRPTRIVADIVIPFGKNRPLALLASPEFFNVRNQVLKAFEVGRQI